MSKEKKTYEKPTLKTWGTIADLTKVGLTNPGADIKSGSVLTPGV
jgi:hypothetical protein